MNITLPPALKQWVEQQIDQSGVATASDYVRQLLRKEQRRLVRLAVEAKLKEAEQSGEPVSVTAQTWKDTEGRVTQRLTRSARRRKHP